MPAATVPFGALLRAQRLRAGLTQRELSRRARVSIRTLREIEQGRSRGSRPALLRRLAAAAGLDPAGLDLDGTVPAGAPSPRPAPPRRKRARGSQGPGSDRLELGVLGPLRVHLGNRPVPIGSRMQRLLLAVLALHPGQVVGREQLIDLLWGAHPPRSCHGLIHTYVARLRRLLEPSRPQHPTPSGVVVAAGGGYRLIAEGSQLDLLRFEELAARAEAVAATDPEAALGLLAQALGLWRGRVLADLPGVLDHDPAVVALAQRRTAAVLTHADLALELGQPQQAATQLGRLAHDEPLHEGVHARLMLALAGGGQQAAALEVFTRLRGRLAEELGVEPGAELQEAQARVLRGEVPASRPPGSPAVVGWVGQSPPAQLPGDVAGFTGRAGDLERLDAMLPTGGDPATTAVVVTAIAGMAGVGKTGLAIHWAHRVADRFPDGQLYLDLRGWAEASPLDPLQALAVLLAGLGVEAHRVPMQLDAAAGLYRSRLAGKRVLVVLDNAHDAAQVRPLLPGHPGCLVLITSRDRLTGLVATHGAHRLELDVLPPGEATSLLGRLLGNDRATAEPATVEELARVCAWLPLALRIAAANLASQPGQTVAGYLAALRDGDRLAELAVEGDAQAAVTVAFDHSYRQLDPDARRLFRLLGLAPGPAVSAAAAAALGGSSKAEAGRLLKRLVAAHLVEARGPHQVGLHDLLRVYARERVAQEHGPAERAAALGRLLDWYLHATDTAARLLYPGKLRLPAPTKRRGPAVPPDFDGPAHAMAWLEAERANLVAAVQHAAAHGPHPAAWRLADALRGYFWLQRHTTQWLLVAHAGLTAAECTGDIRAQAACQLSLGDAHQATGAYRPAIQHYTAALALSRQAGWTDVQAICLDELGMVYWWVGDLQQAADHHLQALDLYRQAGRPSGEATALINHSLANRSLGQLHHAADSLRHALDLFRQLGSRQGMANALGHLGATLHDLGRLDDAHQCLTRALRLYQEVGDRFGQTWVSCALAGVHLETGRHPQALETAQTALRLAGEIGHRAIEAAARSTLASVHRRRRDHQQAIRDDQDALDLTRQTNTRSLEAQVLCGLAAAHHALGQHRQARDHAEQALDLHRQTGHRLGQARTLRLLGHVLTAAGDAQTAIDCWREALKLFTEAGSPETDQLRELLAT